IFKPGAGAAFLWAVLLLGVVSLVSLAMLLRPVRVLVSRVMPIDPDNFVHKIALSVLTLITLGSFVPLIVLSGTPPALLLISQTPSPSQGPEGQNPGVGVGPLDQVYEFVWLIPTVIVAAGWPIGRTFRAALV